MGLLSLFSPTPKVANNDSLLILEQSSKKSLKKVTDLHDFYMNVLEKDPSRKLIISSSLNGQIIPIIDCDGPRDHNLAGDYLRKEKIGFAVFQSSKSPNYWFIPDLTFQHFDDAWHSICYVPGNDHRYLKLTNKIGFFAIRGEYKESSDTPKLVHVSCVSSVVSKFVELLVKHFADERLNVIASIKIKRLLEESKKKNRPSTGGYRGYVDDNWCY